MKIIISPAKKMNVETDCLSIQGLPKFLPEAESLCEKIRGYTYEEQKTLWKCNDKIARLNAERFRDMNLKTGLTPAILSYEGLQYQHIAPQVFTEKELTYIQEHLCILSGFYGVLKPFDGVTPYRLEMGTKLETEGCKDLYEFWGDKLYQEVIKDDGIVINLASKEYSQSISKYILPKERFITVEFGEVHNGKVKQKGTFSKMARGEMVRYMAENQIEDIEKIKEFHVMGLQYAEEFSNENKMVFTV